MSYTLVIAAVIVLAASFIRSVSGFGYALISTPLLTFLFDAKSVVIMNVILGNVTNIIVLFHTRKFIDGRRALILIVSSAFGVPLGAFLLSWLEPSVIKLAIAALVIPFSIILMTGYSFKLKHDSISCAVAGFLSGIFASSTSLGGPVVALFLLNQGMTTERFVGTMAAYFVSICLFSIGSFISMGMVTSDILIRGSILLLPLIIGSYLGVRLIRKINVALFKKITTSILVVSSLAIIVSVLLGI